MSIFEYREQSGYFKRLGEALEVTRQDLSHKLGQVLGSAVSPVDESRIEELEDVLISSDLGVETSLAIVERVREETRGRRVVTSGQIRELMLGCVLEYLQPAPPPRRDAEEPPQVVFFVGVNGVGKTTTLGKLAHRVSGQGKTVIICAADTFRAAAVEQLGIWAERSGSDMVRQSGGADPAAVLFDAIAAGRARRRDVVMVDTAGRIHTRRNLMQELGKMSRVAAREVPGAPHEVFLVLDATTGQNGLQQAREFFDSAGITGIVVTKLDGTAKGGIVVSIVRELGVPVRFVGTGEGIEDLVPFDAGTFARSLFAE